MEVHDEYALDELIHQYMDDEIDFDKIVEFCDNLEPSIKNKNMLMDCIDCYDIEILYVTLFGKFKDTLSREEAEKYRDRFMKTFDRIFDFVPENIMTIEERKIQVRSFLGKTVNVRINRPIGYVHQKETYSISYPINYGYIPGEIGGDGEKLDVYLLGIEEPVDEYVAKVIGIIHRQNDNEDKLVAAPEGMCFTRKQIQDAVNFQEKYYDTYVETETSILQLVFNNGKFENMPSEFIENFRYRTIIPFRENILNFYTEEEYEEICSKSHTVSALSWLYVKKSTMKLPEPDTIEDFVKWYLPTYLYIYDGEVRMNLSWEGRHLQLKVVMFDEWE